MRHQAFRSRLLNSAALLAVVASLGGCMASRGNPEVTGSIGTPPAARSEAEWRRTADSAGERYRANPQNAQAALQYAQALRASGQKTQAVAVLEQAAIVNPGDKALLGAYGRAL